MLQAFVNLLAFVAVAAWAPITSAQSTTFKLIAECADPAYLVDAGRYGTASFRYDNVYRTIVMTWASFDAKGHKVGQGVTHLSGCTVTDDQNWRCGGETVVLSGIASRQELHEMVGGTYRLENDRADSRNCRTNAKNH